MCTCVYMHMKARGEAQVLPHERHQTGPLTGLELTGYSGREAPGAPSLATPALELK